MNYCLILDCLLLWDNKPACLGMFTENKVKCTHLTGTNLGWWDIDTPHVDSPHMGHLGHQTRMVGIISTVFVTKHLGLYSWCFEKLDNDNRLFCYNTFLVVVMTQTMSLIQVDPKFAELIAFHPSIRPLSWLIALWEVTNDHHLPMCHIKVHCVMAGRC